MTGISLQSTSKIWIFSCEHICLYSPNYVCYAGNQLSSEQANITNSSRKQALQGV